MKNAMIRLDCPGCGRSLTLDAGFAGGVCRCSHCSTLMTVPKHPEQEQPEQLTRLERPDDPNANATAESNRPEFPGGTVAPAANTADPEAGDQPVTFVTAEGRQVTIRADRVAIANAKIKLARWLTVLSFMLGLAAIVVAVIFVAVTLTSEQAIDDQVDSDLTQELGYDPEGNPFLLSKPTVLGVPWPNQSIIMIEADGKSDPKLGLIGDALANAIDKMQGSKQTALVYVAEQYTQWITPENELSPAYQWLPLSLEAKDSLRDFRGWGQADWNSALTEVVSLEPKAVVLVISGALNESEQQTIETLFNKGAIKLTVIQLDFASEEMSELAQKYNGRAIELPVVRLRRWYTDWLDAESPTSE